jgi:hypothetical protein
MVHFKDYPDFTPNLTPQQIFSLGSFGGTYWRPIFSKVNKKSYKHQHKEFSWLRKLPKQKISSVLCEPKINNYKVSVGTSLKFWESKGWINSIDPYGWVQWYCRFYDGRRSDDDARQIKRWLRLAGPKGRFRKWLISLIQKKKGYWNDHDISPKIRQTLQHWGYRLTKKDFETELTNRKQKNISTQSKRTQSKRTQSKRTQSKRTQSKRTQSKRTQSKRKKSKSKD